MSERSTQEEVTSSSPSSSSVVKKEKQHVRNEEEYEEVQITSFDDLGLSDEILRGIYSHGFERPSEIQRKVIKPIMDGRSVIVESEAGTGKTAAYLIGLIPLLNINDLTPQVIVLAPTREVAHGVSNLAKNIGTYCPLLTTLCIVGLPFKDTLTQLQNGTHLVVGTPGRVMDVMKRGLIQGVRGFVLDEADEMFARGFKDQIYEIVMMLGKVQMVVATSTRSDEVSNLIQNFMNDPILMTRRKFHNPLEFIRQYYVDVEKGEWKLEVLLDLLEVTSVAQIVIFCNTVRIVDYLIEKLKEREFSVCFSHGQMEPWTRNETHEAFGTGASRILVTTDLLDRRLFSLLSSISLVLNYDFPTHFEHYLHRVGRRGRIQQVKSCISFITKEETSHLREMENYYGIKVEELPANVSDFL